MRHAAGLVQTSRGEMRCEQVEAIVNAFIFPEATFSIIVWAVIDCSSRKVPVVR
jgi:hypothetical protein